MTVERIAANIALIPSKDMLDFAIELNRSFPETAPEDYVLDEKTCIPHVTLLMGVMARDQLPEISASLGGVAERFSLLDLRADSLSPEIMPDKSRKAFSSLSIERTAELQRLHEAIMDTMAPFFSWDDVEIGMFYSPPRVREVSSHWVEGYAKNSAWEKYDPHISLGFTDAKRSFTPRCFTASRLALCHLGNYCTCRDILWEADLKA